MQLQYLILILEALTRILILLRACPSYGSTLCAAGITPDIITLTETWLSEPVDIDGYLSFHTFRTEGKSGGVSIFVKNCYSATKLSEFCLVNNTIESCTVRLALGDLKITLLAIYRPHADTIYNFCQVLDDLLSNRELNKNVCVLGDINVNLLDQDCRSVSNFTSIMRTYNFIPCITKPTRLVDVSQNGNATLLDHIWTNLSHDYLGLSGVLLDNTTDHCPTFITLQRALIFNNNFPNELVKVKFRLVDDVTMEKYTECLSSIDWPLFFNNSGNINKATDSFLNRLNDAYCSCFPIRIKYIGKKRLGKPWLNSNILRYIKYKSSSFKRYKNGFDNGI